MFVDQFLHRHVFSFLLGTEQAVESMSHSVTLFNVLRNWQTLSNVIAPFYIPTSSAYDL